MGLRNDPNAFAILLIDSGYSDSFCLYTRLSLISPRVELFITLLRVLIMGMLERIALEQKKHDSLIFQCVEAPRMGARLISPFKQDGCIVL
jgi:hypothetical protein